MKEKALYECTVHLAGRGYGLYAKSFSGKLFVLVRGGLFF